MLIQFPIMLLFFIRQFVKLRPSTRVLYSVVLVISSACTVTAQDASETLVTFGMKNVMIESTPVPAKDKGGRAIRSQREAELYCHQLVCLQQYRIK